MNRLTYKEDRRRKTQAMHQRELFHMPFHQPRLRSTQYIYLSRPSGIMRDGMVENTGPTRLRSIYICDNKLTKMLSGPLVHNLNSLINLATLGNLWIALNAHSIQLSTFGHVSHSIALSNDLKLNCSIVNEACI